MKEVKIAEVFQGRVESAHYELFESEFKRCKSEIEEMLVETITGFFEQLGIKKNCRPPIIIVTRYTVGGDGTILFYAKADL